MEIPCALRGETRINDGVDDGNDKGRSPGRRGAASTSSRRGRARQRWGYGQLREDREDRGGHVRSCLQGQGQAHREASGAQEDSTRDVCPFIYPASFISLGCHYVFLNMPGWIMNFNPHKNKIPWDVSPGKWLTSLEVFNNFFLQIVVNC